MIITVIIVIVIPAISIIAIPVSVSTSRSTHVDTRRGPVLAIRQRELDPDRRAVEIGPVQSVLGLLGVLHSVEIHKCEPTRPVSSWVGDELHALHTAVFVKSAVNLAFRCVVGEAEDAEAARRARVGSA